MLERIANQGPCDDAADTAYDDEGRIGDGETQGASCEEVRPSRDDHLHEVHENGAARRRLRGKGPRHRCHEDGGPAETLARPSSVESVNIFAKPGDFGEPG